MKLLPLRNPRKEWKSGGQARPARGWQERVKYLAPPIGGETVSSRARDTGRKLKVDGVDKIRLCLATKPKRPRPGSCKIPCLAQRVG